MSEGKLLYTLDKPGFAEYDIQRSRFLAYSAPFSAEEEILDFIRQIKADHPDARHHCSAYILKGEKDLVRCQDDGEPSGTAGLPILDRMQKKQLINCAVVVVRYFGGILLGSGGLKRAYGHSASLSIEASGMAKMLPSVKIEMTFDYASLNRLDYLLQSATITALQKSFESEIKMSFIVSSSDSESLIAQIADRFENRISIAKSDDFLWKWPIQVL